MKKLFLIGLLIVSFCAHGFSAEAPLTRSEILSITDAEAGRLGYNVEEMSVSFDAYNSLWVDSLEKIGKGDRSSSDRFSFLKDKEFILAVYYAPMKRQPGGDLWVFVDLANFYLC